MYVDSDNKWKYRVVIACRIPIVVLFSFYIRAGSEGVSDRKVLGLLLHMDTRLRNWSLLARRAGMLLIPGAGDVALDEYVSAGNWMLSTANRKRARGSLTIDFEKVWGDPGKALTIATNFAVGRVRKWLNAVNRHGLPEGTTTEQQ